MSSNNNIPFLDLITPHIKLKDELTTVFTQALQTAGFIGGPMVEGFEKDFAVFCDTRHCIGVNSGTDALRFALIAAGVNIGDTVITVPNTFIATTEAISQAGAIPAFVDIDEKTYNMDPNKLEDYLKKHSALRSSRFATQPKAIIPVHLYGQMADMNPILELAEKYNLMVIEDACQAHGAEYFSKKENRWRKSGSMGIAAAFSFYPGKNLGACGEGGAVTTNNEEISKKIRMLRDHGQSKKYYHDIEGYNGRLDAIQAGILQVKLRHLSGWNEERRANAFRYNKFLQQIEGIITPYEPEWSRSVYHLYVIRTKNRDELQSFLTKNNIASGLHYPVPLHLQKAYKDMEHKNGGFPISEKASLEILSLPMYPGLAIEQQEHVVEKIKRYFSET